jgi:hypothetical protein
MPKILDEAVKAIQQNNPSVSESSAYAMGTAALQKSGSLKKASNQPTKQGVKRGHMSRAERQRTPPRK